MGLLGPQGLFFYFGIVSLFLALFAFLKRRRDGSPDKPKPFVVVPATQATLNKLYIFAHDVSPDSVATNVKPDPKL